MIQPRLALLLPVPYSEAEIRTTLKHLRGQSIAAESELILLSPPGVEIGPLEGFQSVRHLQVGPFASVGEYLEVGVRRAHAPVVMICEDHSFPQPGWGEALLAAHETGPWAAVGATMSNGNPDSVVSWASYQMNFAHASSEHGGEVSLLAGHQTSYKRDVLLAMPDLPALLECEGLLHAALRQRGHRLFLESRAHTVHYNVEYWRPFALEQFYGTWVYGALRCRRWSSWKRCFYAVAAPLICALRLNRSRSWLARAPRKLPVLLATLFGVMAGTAGEVAGYLAGEGEAAKRRFDGEFRRHRYVRDRQPWA